MSKNIDFRLAIAGILLGAIGVIGTFYQILGQKILWIILIIIGFAPALFYLWKIASETGAVVKTFGKRWCLAQLPHLFNKKLQKLPCFFKK